MNNEKAREYFSAYSEGTLDAGLARAFESKLNADSGLKQEFDLFQSTVRELDSLREEAIEIPFDLNERISAAVDRSIYEKKQTAQLGWTLWLRNLAFGGLAAAAIVAAYMSITSGSHGGPASAGIGINSPAPVRTIEQIEYKKSKNGIQMDYRPSAKHTVSIKGGREGDKTVDVDANGWLNNLSNDQPQAAVFVVEVAGELPPTSVVVPGTERSNSGIGQGSLEELGKAIANKYGIPVLIKVDKLGGELSWNLSDPDGYAATQTALNGVAYRVDMKDGILTISDN